MIQWAIVGVYVLTMFLFASQEASSASYTGTLLAKWLPHLSPSELRQLVIWGRKIGHAVAYGVLTLLVYYAARNTKRLKRGALLLAVGFAIMVAIVDEGYQSRLPYRTGTFDDVLLDGLGTGVAALGLYLRSKIRRQHKEVAEDAKDER